LVFCAKNCQIYGIMYCVKVSKRAQKMGPKKAIFAVLILLITAIAVWPSGASATQTGWQRQEVNWPAFGGGRVTAIKFPAGRPPQLADDRLQNHNRLSVKDVYTTEGYAPSTLSAPALTSAITVDSPSLGGFISWIVVTLTDERLGEWEIDAVPSDSIVGDYLTSTPESDFAIAVFDTGAGLHVMGSDDAVTAGLFGHWPDLITSNTVDLFGISGEPVTVLVSQPIGVFIDGLAAVEPDGLITDRSKMLGQTNVSIAVGDPDESPGLLTTVGTPLSVYYAAAFYNDQPITITRDDVRLTAPDIRFYDLDDPCIPSYPNSISLVLRPTGAYAVEYLFNFIDPEDPSPLIPSTIMGGWTATALFFFDRVDLANGSRSALQNENFIFDTGSSYTIVSEALGAVLELDPDNPDFEIEILTATAEVITAPGYYIDLLETPASKGWLSFTNVPVVMLDAPSPEGGILDGIIGTNLFVDFNYVFKGGGLPGQDQPALEFAPIPARIVGDIAPAAGDGKVGFIDLAAFAGVWLSSSESFDWNPKADMGPAGRPDGIINLLDFAVFAEHWLENAAQ
jgi:hypothetical protein